MNSANSDTIRRNFHSRNHGSRLYVWVLTSSTVLLLAMLIWPMSVKKFQSNVTFQLRFDPTSRVEKREISKLIIDEIREHTERSQLPNLLSALTDEPTSPLLIHAESQPIRDAIRIQSRPGNAANTVWFRVSLVGRGTRDEVQFVNALVSRITSNIGTSMLKTSALESIDRLTRDLEKQRKQLFNEHAESLDVALSGLRSAGNELQIVIDNLDSLGQTAPDSSAGVSNGASAEQLRNQIAALESQMRQLLSDQSINEYHPQSVTLRQQIENLRGQLDRIHSPSDRSGQFQGDMVRVSNQFASSRLETPVSDSSIGDIVEEIRMIDLARPREMIKQIQQSLQQPNEPSELLIERMNSRAKEQLFTVNPISFDHVRPAKRSRPVGGVPSLSHFFAIAIFSGLLATVIALKFDPQTRKRRFRSIQQIQYRLRIPVVGSLRSRPIREKPISKSARTVGWVVTLCEWIILLMLITLLIAAFVNSDVVGALLENPFEAASKMFWLIIPQS